MSLKKTHTLLFLLINFFCLAQNKQIDSLKIKLKNTQTNALKANLLNDIGDLYFTENTYDSSIHYYNKSLVLAQKNENKKLLSDVLGNLGLVYYNQNKYPIALNYYVKALAINEEFNFKEGISRCYTNIGIIYDLQKNYKLALDYYQKSLSIDQQLNDSLGVSSNYINIGTVYDSQKKHTQALRFLEKALVIKLKLNDVSGVSKIYTNIGLINEAQKKYDSALYYFNKSLEIDEKYDDKEGIAICLINLSSLNIKLTNYTLAKEQILKSLAISKQIKTIENESIAYELLSIADFNLGNHKEAYINQLKFKKLNDSIFNIENSIQLSNTKTNYEVDKKEAELKAKAKVIAAVSLEEKKRQQLIIYIIIVVLVIVTLFTFLLFKRFKLTNKQKRIIELKEKQTQNQYVIINEQKKLVEKKHKEITDSINYAERIQRSFLASNEFLNQHLKNYFIYFQPKAIVSGDFYWAASIGSANNKNFILVTADSTGHGVPGAIMSLLNTTSIESVIKQGFTQPAEILNQTRKTIIERLNKDGTEGGGKDGMDCSIISFDFENYKMTYAAANNPILIVRKNKIGVTEVHEAKPDKMPVGKNDKDKAPFTQHDFNLLKGDIVYTLTDGFADQFGGAKGKKFMHKQLKELLVNIAQEPINKQSSILQSTFQNWKGDLEQVDDVLIIGIKI